MTFPYGAATNVADGAASIGVQAGVVHGDVSVYQGTSESAEDRYRTGVHYLDGGMPTKAREFIRAAMAGGFDNSEVQFHWLLALLSGRTIRQFSAEDESSLQAERERPPSEEADQWAEGLRVINYLLDSADAPETDLGLVIKSLDALGTIQQDKILRHLDMFLSGPVEDQVWNRALNRVKVEQLDHARQDRVWMFFQPKPKGPQLRCPVPQRTTPAGWLRLMTACAAFVVAASWLQPAADRTRQDRPPRRRSDQPRRCPRLSHARSRMARPGGATTRQRPGPLAGGAGQDSTPGWIREQRGQALQPLLREVRADWR